MSVNERVEFQQFRHVGTLFQKKNSVAAVERGYNLQVICNFVLNWHKQFSSAKEGRQEGWKDGKKMGVGRTSHDIQGLAPPIGQVSTAAWLTRRIVTSEFKSWDSSVVEIGVPRNQWNSHFKRPERVDPMVSFWSVKNTLRKPQLTA